VDPKRVYYLSMEFLMGRSLLNALNNLDIKDQYKEAIEELGYKLETLVGGRMGGGGPSGQVSAGGVPSGRPGLDCVHTVWEVRGWRGAGKMCRMCCVCSAVLLYMVCVG